MKEKSHVVYLKLEPYLQDYCRWMMHLHADDPLCLPVKQHRELFLPFLCENTLNARRGGKNSKGYWKDATSYSEYAYIHSPYAPHPLPVKDDISRVGDKFPSEREYSKLVAFAMPDTIARNADVLQVNRMYELSESGCKLVREYIREECLQDLHAFILGKTRHALAHNRTINITREIELWKGSHCIRDGFNLREIYYKSYGCGDTDSLRRTVREGVKNRKLRRFPK